MCRSCYEKNLRKYKTKVINKIDKKIGFNKYKKLKEKYLIWLTKKRKLSRQNTTLKYKYGITLKFYNKLLKKQKGKCLICEKTSKRTLHIDHDHKTGKIRGLLCFRCNYGLGYFKDNLKIFKNIVKYLGEKNAL